MVRNKNIVFRSAHYLDKFVWKMSIMASEHYFCNHKCQVMSFCLEKKFSKSIVFLFFHKNFNF